MRKGTVTPAALDERDAAKKDVTAPARRSRAHTKSAKALPKMPGAVYVQYRYYKGKRLGPYYFRFWREHGKLHKQYIKRADVAAVMAACAAYRDEQQDSRHSRAALKRWIKGFNRTSREVERWVTMARSSR